MILLLDPDKTCLNREGELEGTYSSRLPSKKMKDAMQTIDILFCAGPAFDESCFDPPAFLTRRGATPQRNSRLEDVLVRHTATAGVWPDIQNYST